MGQRGETTLRFTRAVIFMIGYFILASTKKHAATLLMLATTTIKTLPLY